MQTLNGRLQGSERHDRRSLRRASADASPGTAAARRGGGPDPRVAALSTSYLSEMAMALRKRYGDGPPDPDDVAQEAFRRIIEKGDTSNIQNLKAFLWRTARNLILDTKKIDKVRSKYDYEIQQIFFTTGGDISSPENVIIVREQLRAINECLRGMSERRRRAFLLYRVDGLTLEEVARRLMMSRTAVSNHIAKAQTQLIALFAGDAED